MRIDVAEERLFVISDLHLGNPSSTARARVVEFLEYVLHTGASVCVNGDGLDFVQGTFPRLAADVLPVLAQLRKIQHRGANVYYIVGNHDLALEHFLSDLVFTEIVPFLNVRSGDRRVRVEHGHLYDPWFCRIPRVYTFGMRLAGYGLALVPDVYQLYSRTESRLRRERLWRGNRAADERGDPTSPYHLAAQRILERGFDAVVFGHTHDAEMVAFPDGTYVNSGNWLRGDTFIEIREGKVELRNWSTVLR